MNQKGFSLILVIIAGAVLVTAGGGFWYYQQSAKQPKQQGKKIDAQSSSPQTTGAQTLESHEMPKLLTIQVESGVDKKYADKTLRGINIMDFYLNQWFGKSITRKSLMKIEVSREDNKFFEGDDGTAVYLNRTLSDESQMVDRLEAQFPIMDRSRLMAHEYIHFFQFNGGCVHPGKTGRSGTGENAEKARWFLEGEAEWLSYKAFDESGKLPIFFSHGRWLTSSVFFLGKSVRPLQMYDEAKLDTTLYPYLTLAVDFLMKNRDIKTLDDFCVNLGKKQDVSVAFQNAFGVSFETFRSAFEAYFTKTFSISVEAGGAPPSVDKESQIPQGYSSWADFCKVQPKDSRCGAYKP